MEYHLLRTEQANKRSSDIDQMSSFEIAELMNKEDAEVASAVQKELAKIGLLIDIGVQTLEQNGRIFYVGTGTSGRLGVLDASEIPATFNTSPDQFIGIIAGGAGALQKSMPKLEDDFSAAKEVLENYHLSTRDLVIGITASGTARFVAGAVCYAQSVNAKTAIISCNKNTEIGKTTDVAIEVDTGPEVILGSTRLMAGTAQKMVLNIFSTGTMIKMGKVYRNYMVDFSTENKKLSNRALAIFMEVTGLSKDEAASIFEKTGKNLKESIVMALTNEDLNSIREEMKTHKGRIRDVIEALSNSNNRS